ncbi:MAG: hypothetical protein LYZ69_02420 [Nitrososphaerales archaeon]|nr:hypothetical protein [Nitrososphaerales archaeon]
MSTRSKKPKVPPAKKALVEEKPAAPERVGMVRPKGSAPIAMVSVRHEGEIVMRAGRGFSFGELGDTALPLLTARRWKVPLDLRRRSTLAANVQALRRWHEHAPKAAAPKVAAPMEPKEPREHKEPKVAPKKEKAKKPVAKKRAAAGKKKPKR